MHSTFILKIERPNEIEPAFVSLAPVLFSVLYPAEWSSRMMEFQYS